MRLLSSPLLLALEQGIQQQLEHFWSLCGVLLQSGLDELTDLGAQLTDVRDSCFINLNEREITLRIACITAERSEL